MDIALTQPYMLGASKKFPYSQLYYNGSGSDDDVVKAIKANLQSLLDMANICDYGSSPCTSDKVEVYLGLCKEVSQILCRLNITLSACLRLYG